MTFATERLIRPRTPEWVRYLNQRLPGETPHSDDKFFRGSDAAAATDVTVSGNAAWSEGRNRTGLEYSGQASSDLVARLWPLTPGSAPVTIETALATIQRQQNFFFAGVCLTDGVVASSNVIWVAYETTGGDTLLSYSSGTLTSAGSPSAVLQSASPSVPDLIYMRVVWKSANTFQRQFSVDGIQWTNKGTANITPTITPTHFGIFGSSWGNSDTGLASFEYLRVDETDPTA